MGRVAQIWRHPIKAHGCEELTHVSLSEGQTLPWDRTWAVAHEASKADGSDWVPCANFSRGAKAPGLMAIRAKFDETTKTLTLTHPDLAELRFRPDDEGDKLIAWTRPLMPEDRAASARVIAAPERGMTDTDYPSVSIGNLATLRAVEEKLGQPLDVRRWRMNLWLDGLAPWQEFDWVGKEIRIGGARLRISEPVTRCLATTANPETGIRDADTLGALKSWGHTDMGVYGEVTASGDIAIGDNLETV
ncbi:hypothetical protein EDD52_110149 [Primorskyibacter sedentarius]|uniref:MOSC domain-containing protein n=1 Tax=Primorskyibacter sedentarius TaxID=745311 RepID=A0A4R3J8X6_9RHOB|nr:MOSC N-terminal beta barrel domain-containing protein [Primorskyibacter sedentarius]TCS61974.1 hypothetical protein EDD52_110149 [Primorskyibacter sedentarius]